MRAASGAVIGSATVPFMSRCTCLRSAVISSSASAALVPAPVGLQPHGHFNEEKPRGLHPELFRAAAIMRYQCLGNRGELRLA